MSEKAKQEFQQPKQEKKIKEIPSNVVQLKPDQCACEECKKKPEKAGFCAEHFKWFKYGLITRIGIKVADFDKKYQHFLRSA